MSIALRLAGVVARIRAAEVAAGRELGSARLVAVSKTHPASAARECVLTGQLDLGENYAAEMDEKRHALADLNPRWHFIGRIQRNKARLIAGAYRVHAVERVEQAEALVRHAPTVTGLVSVNLGGEASKGGVPPEQTLALLRALRAVPGFVCAGLMTMPPPVDDPSDAVGWFRSLAELRDAGQADGHTALQELSMGMSHDFEEAIACGATWVRVGTAIFGERG